MRKYFAFTFSFIALFLLCSCGETTAENENKTLGTTMLEVFRENSDKGVQEIASLCLENPAIEFMGGAVPAEPGALTGFDAEITGFSEGAMFAPNIGTIPFVGYVLKAEENAAELAETLKTNANPRWNICTEAEEIICEAKGDKVFFLMCPKSLSQQ